MRPAAARRGARGFTLLEVLLVVIAATILAGVVIPAAATFDDQQVSADARVLVADFEVVQARAIATSQPHRVVFDPENDRYQVEAPPGVVIDEPLTKRPWIRKLAAESSHGSDLLSADFGTREAIIFDAAGQPDSAGVVTFGNGQFTAQVRVQAVTGSVDAELP